MAGPYQLPSDGFDHKAFSGVIKSDGTWVPCEHDNEEWKKYEDWLAEDKDPPNQPDPYRSPADGGVKINLASLKKGTHPVGVIWDSLSPEDVAKAKEALAVVAPAVKGSLAAQREAGANPAPQPVPTAQPAPQHAQAPAQGHSRGH